MTTPSDARPLVLVAEDEEFNYYFIQEILFELPINLLHVETGKQAVDLCRQNPEIALILMDIKMPEMDGYQAAKLIKDFRPSLPIVAQTAYALESERKRYGHIFDAYLTKPIDETRLVNTVRSYLFER